MNTSFIFDIFSNINALRSQDLLTNRNAFINALKENKNLATKLFFYIRDIRGGQGERKAFIESMIALIEYDEDLFNIVAPFIPEYGRWDDLIKIVFSIDNIKYAKAWNCVMEIIKAQLLKDSNPNESPSLLAKWMPSINTSSKITRLRAVTICRHLSLTPKQYRKTLTSLRSRLEVLEVKMSANKWSDIKYSNVPSLAFKRYSNAFIKRDGDRFNKHLNSVKNGEDGVKINAGAIFPHEIVKECLLIKEEMPFDEVKKILALNEQWKAIPNFLPEDYSRTITVVDVSGSMLLNTSPRPIDVSIGLGLYLAERYPDEGLRNKFITFSTYPEVVCIDPNSGIYGKVVDMSYSGWGMSTDISKVFELLLNTLVLNSTPSGSEPETILVITDMQFNGDNDDNFVEKFKSSYKKAGYVLPKIVFWNVSPNKGSNNKTQSLLDGQCIYVSGFSPSLMKTVLSSSVKDMLPYNIMLEILNSDRYKQIEV